MFARSAADWSEYLRNAGVPCVVARESSWLHEYLTDPTVLAAHRATRSKHETAGTVSVIGPFVRLASAVPTAESRAPGLGEHSTTILGELGIDDDAIASLIAAGTVVADRSGDRT